MRNWLKIASLVTLFATLCAGAHADPLRVRIGWITAPASRAGYLTEKMDLLKHYDKSYTVDAIVFSNTPTELTALASGELDIAELSFPAFGTAIENAHLEDVRLIADQFEDGVPGYATTEFMVLKDSPIKSIDDLKGKVIATNGIGTGIDMALRYIMRRHHMEANRDYSDVEVNFANMRATLAEHKIDAGSLVTPFTYDSQLTAIARTLFKQGDEIGPSELSMWAARAPYIQANRPALVDLLEDALRVQHWYVDPANHDEAVAIIARITKRKPEDLGWIFSNKDDYRNPNGRPNLDALAANLRMQKDLGYLKTDIDVPKYADLSLVDEASKRLGN